MAASSVEDEISSKTELSDHCINNNKVVQVETNKDLLHVCPERGLERYLLKNDHKVGIPLKTYRPQPCQALRQVKAFLPVLEKAQKNLSNEDLNIEEVGEDESYIDMDVQFVELDESDESSTESENRSSDESEESIEDFGEVTENNIVVSKSSGKKRPLIEDIT